MTAEIHNGETVSVARDALGRRTGRRTPSGVESRWSYDALGLPRRMDLGGHSLTFARDRAGREVERRIGTGAILAQQWDAGHRLTAQTLWGVPATPQGQARLLQHRTYSYRADGHVLAIGDRLAGDRSLSLDSVGRVTAVDARDWTERYAYDATGNLTGAEWPAGHAPPWGDDALGDREYSGTLVRRAGRVRFEHDGQGRVVLRQHTTLSGKRIAWRYRWDADDLLVGVETRTGSVGATATIPWAAGSPRSTSPPTGRAFTSTSPSLGMVRSSSSRTTCSGPPNGGRSRRAPRCGSTSPTAFDPWRRASARGLPEHGRSGRTSASTPSSPTSWGRPPNWWA
nr:hypothetical protein [Actinomadura sp. J1-007]